MSNRARLGISDDMRTDIALEGIAGKRLTYRRTVQPITLKQKRQAFVRWRKKQGGAVSKKRRPPWKRWWKPRA